MPEIKQPLLAIIPIVSPFFSPRHLTSGYYVQILDLYTGAFKKICKTQSLPSRNLQKRRGEKYTKNNTGKMRGSCKGQNYSARRCGRGKKWLLITLEGGGAWADGVEWPGGRGSPKGGLEVRLPA